MADPATEPSGVRKLYLVRLRSEPTPEGGAPRRLRTVERGFADRSAAEADCAQRDRTAFLSDLGGDLFAFVPYVTETFFDLTSFDPPVFLDWLTDANIPHPEGTAEWRDWERWWTAVWPALDNQQRLRLCEALDKFSFYEIVEVDWLAQPSAEVPQEWWPEVPEPSPPPGEEGDGEAWAVENDPEIPF
jgi:hypothetical protein